MKVPFLPALLSAALIGLPTGASHAALLLQPAGVSTTMDAFDTTAVGNIIDQSQLSLGYDSLVTDFDTYLAGAPTHNSQLLSGHFSGDDNGANGVFDGGFIDFDLGGSYLVQRLVLWTDGSDLPAELRGFTLLASATADFANPTMLGSFTASGPGPFTAVEAEVFDFPDTQAAHIRMEVTGNNGGSRTLIGEVAFDVVPEPSTALLLAAGAVGLSLRRRRQDLTV